MSRDAPDPARKPVEAEALDWLVRSRMTSFDDWPGLQTWLQRSPGNGAAFDAELARAERLDAMIPALREALARRSAPVSGQIPAYRMRWALAAGMAAAIAVVVLLCVVLMGRNGARSVVATGAGQSRVLTLESGASIALGPEGRVDLVSSRTGELVVMRRGDLRLRAPASHPLMVLAGDDMVRVADASALVHRRQGRLKIKVADGSVFIGPASGRRGPRVTLPPGSWLDHVEGTTVFRVHEPSASDLVIR